MKAANQTTDATLLVIADAAMLKHPCETFIASSASCRDLNSVQVLRALLRLNLDWHFKSS
jgi:hypothetical protein